MKRVIAFVLVAVSLVLCAGCAEKAPYEAAYVELGNPLEETYFGGIKARSAWDVEVYKNTLYIGSGDYDVNQGPVHMWFYDFDKGEWALEEFLEDEQIARFCEIDGVLYAPGIDPRVSWETGSYYTNDGEGGWDTHIVLPGGVHNFDIVKFDGKLFAGLGVEDGNHPIVTSTDGENWAAVPLYKDGAPRETNGATYIRVYDFFTLNGSLYAYFSISGNGVKAAKEIYRLDGDKFVYHSDMMRDLPRIKCIYLLLYQKVEFKGKQYFSTGYLYETEDMVTASPIDFGEETVVTDLRVIGKNLYALCATPIKNEDGSTTFRNSVRKSRNGKTFNEVFYFDYDVRALSFTYHNDNFYFGMGYGAGTTDFYEGNGMVLSVEYAKAGR